jgi:hypothetical protein
MRPFCPAFSAKRAAAPGYLHDGYRVHDQIQDYHQGAQNPPPGVPKRDIYLIRAYEYPEEWDDYPQSALYQKLLEIRLQLRAMGEEKHDMIVFSFWPDVIMIKEIGDPCRWPTT